MAVPGEAHRPGALGDSWGGWVVVFTAACPLLYSAVTVLFDGRNPVVTSTGRIVVEASGRWGTTVAGACLTVAAACSLFALVTPRLGSARLGAPVTFPLMLVLAWGTLTSWLREDGMSQVVQSALIVLMALAVVVSSPSVTTLSRLSALRDLLAAGSLAYSTMVPAAQSPCRPDKCGIFGSLWYGLFENENAAGAAVALLIPTLFIAGRLRYAASMTLAIVFVAATGSRTAIIATIAALAYLTTVRRPTVRQAGAPLAWRPIPGAALLISLAVFLSATGSGLTGRGSVYTTIRDTLSPTALAIGAGPNAIEGLLSGWVNSAHGEAPNILVMYGVPGLVLCLAAAAQLLWLRHWPWQRLAGLGVLVTASARFPTEASFMLGLRTTELAMVLLTIGCFASPPPGGDVSADNLVDSAGQDTGPSSRSAPVPTPAVMPHPR